MTNSNLPDDRDPSDTRPVVALLATLGTEALLSNAIRGILRTAVDPSRIRVGCPENIVASMKSVTRPYSDQIQVISVEGFAPSTQFDTYSNFGSRQFTSISWMKIFFIRQLLGDFQHVIYSDLDVVWLRDPIPYLIQVARMYPLAFQTEGLPRFPPAVCAGFSSLVKSERTTTFIRKLIELRNNVAEDSNIDDQAACQQLIEGDPAWLSDIFMLPEALFPNGLGYRSMQDKPANLPPMEGELSPFLFHANWTIGLENKHRLLAATGNWLIDEPIRHDQAPTPPEDRADSSGGEIGSRSISPLLTVIYPIFDIRSDVIQCVRCWTEQQAIAADRYRVVVAASAGTALDEQALRNALRSQDSLIVVPGTGRDADFWNVGARAAGTPWLLFVEGHTVPERESLSELAEWIDSHPETVACNFRIKNHQDHVMAELMKRWFVQIHAAWSQPSTWPRLHRAAFAIRRDAFWKVGPLEPQYGQFAPALFSARMHAQGLTISTLPAATVNHEDSAEMSAHHDDTADYVRGELSARRDNDPSFFEEYFGPSPYQESLTMLPARCARSMTMSLFVAAYRRPLEAFPNLATALTLLPLGLIGLKHRIRMLEVLIRVTEFAVMKLPLGKEMRWKRFIAAHRRVIRTEQMRWMQRNSRPLDTSFLEQTRPVCTPRPEAILGLHELEYSAGAPFRWTHPLFILRLEPPSSNGTLVLETRNLRRRIDPVDLSVVVGSKILSSRDIAVDEAGNIRLSIRTPVTATDEMGIAIVVPALREPGTEFGAGRRLGLPLFSILFARDSVATALAA